MRLGDVNGVQLAFMCSVSQGEFGEKYVSKKFATVNVVVLAGTVAADRLRL